MQYKEAQYFQGNRRFGSGFYDECGFSTCDLFIYRDFLDFKPIFDAARDVEAVDFIVQQYWEHPYRSRLYQLPKVLLQEIVRFIRWDPVVEKGFATVPQYYFMMP